MSHYPSSRFHISDYLQVALFSLNTAVLEMLIIMNYSRILIGSHL